MAELSSRCWGLAEGPEGLARLVERVASLRLRGAASIRDGSLEEALRQLSGVLARLEAAGGQNVVVRRPFTGISSEAYLLGEMARALRLRMEQLGRDEVSGLSYFYRHLDDLLARLQGLAGYAAEGHGGHEY